jgi:hypothetical protein
MRYVVVVRAPTAGLWSASLADRRAISQNARRMPVLRFLCRPDVPEGGR